jgi:predicted alpha/beta hydrolase
MERKSIKLLNDTHLNLNFFRSKRGNPNAPVFVILPALGVRESYYSGLASSLSLDGNHVVSFGWDKEVEDTKEFDNHGYKEVLEFDLPLILSEVRSKFKNSKIYFLGHSVGIHYGLLYCALNPGEISGLISIAGGSYFYKKLNGLKRTKRKVDYHIIKNISKFLGHFPGELIGLSKGPGKLMRDWAKEGLRGNFSHIDKRADKLIEKLDIPILFITLNNDKHISLEGSEHLLSRLKKAQITRLHLRDEYGIDELHHIKWVKTPEPVVEKIQDWIHTPK